MFSRWFCEGKELENSPDIQIITNGERHSLIIAEAFEEDTGRYSCFASNFYGTDSTSAEIYIEGKQIKFIDHFIWMTKQLQLHFLAASFYFLIGASSSDSDGEQDFQAQWVSRFSNIESC